MPRCQALLCRYTGGSGGRTSTWKKMCAKISHRLPQLLGETPGREQVTFIPPCHRQPLGISPVPGSGINSGCASKDRVCSMQYHCNPQKSNSYKVAFFWLLLQLQLHVDVKTKRYSQSKLISITHLFNCASLLVALDKCCYTSDSVMFALFCISATGSTVRMSPLPFIYWLISFKCKKTDILFYSRGAPIHQSDIRSALI